MFATVNAGGKNFVKIAFGQAEFDFFVNLLTIISTYIRGIGKLILKPILLNKFVHSSILPPIQLTNKAF